MKLPVLYFIKYFERNFLAYFSKISRCDATFVFDLEDSIQATGDDFRTRELKKTYRDILFRILVRHELDLNYKIGIRLNSLRSSEFEHDIRLLRKLDHIAWETILFPKIESSQELITGLNLLADNNIQYNNVGIFAETQTGIQSLEAIVKPARDSLKYIVFGHSDYCYDLGIFPLWHQDSNEYWGWIDTIYNTLRNSEYVFINSPCFYLKDNLLLNHMLNKLHEYSDFNVGQMTLTLQQTQLCNHYSVSSANHSPILNPVRMNPSEFARKIYSWTNNSDSDKGFSINQQNYLLTPHEILMAQNHLVQLSEA